MSYSSLDAQSHDAALAGRVTAAAQQEARTSAAASDFGRAIVNNEVASPVSVLIWPVCIATEAAYESALAAGNPNPGGDPAVITDQAILSAVQAGWPPDPWPPA